MLSRRRIIGRRQQCSAMRPMNMIHGLLEPSAEGISRGGSATRRNGFVPEIASNPFSAYDRQRSEQLCRSRARGVAEPREIVLKEGWLSQAPSWFQQEVLAHCRLKALHAGEMAYRIGDPPGGIYGLVAGSLAVLVAPRERGPHIAYFGRPGTWFGDVAAITGQPRRISLLATRDSETLHLSLPAIHQIVSKDPSAWRLFALISIGHFDVAVGACDDMTIHDDRKRFVAVLLRLGDCRTASRSDTASPQIDITQEDLAMVANLARTTVCAFLRELQSAGQVEYSYRCIRILKPGALRASLLE
jgi:CRP/FNR family transcriptional regulator, cyclic AMP receptor protein